MISVIVATRNRPDKINNCLKSILANKFSPFEIVIADQSDNDLTSDQIKLSRSKKIRYFKLDSVGKSKAINFALGKARGNIIAFTDDDCIVAGNWLKEINTVFQKNKDISGVFGKILPYQPKKNKGKFCACTFERKKAKIFEKPIDHWQVGYGNNMVFKKHVFESIGGFEEWLGPGSIGKTAEDAEITLRSLFSGYKILTTPKVVVCHDRWLDREEFKRQQFRYFLGEAACYTYFFLQGKKIAGRQLVFFLIDFFRQLKLITKGMFKLKGHDEIGDKDDVFIKSIFYRLKGFCLGFVIYCRNKHQARYGFIRRARGPGGKLPYLV